MAAAPYPSPLCECASRDPRIWSKTVADAPQHVRELLLAAAREPGSRVIKTVAALSFGNPDQTVLYALLRRHNSGALDLFMSGEERFVEVECGIARGETEIAV